MEPILQNPQFTKLLRVWEFITAYYEYLELPVSFEQVSLYELCKHIEYSKHMTSMISQIIEALVKKATGHQKTNKNTTILFLARNNKFHFFDDLVKTSYYQLGLSQVNFSLAWRDLPQIDSSKPFQALEIHDKYRYLITLINLVSTGAHFKNQYLEKIKKQYAEANQKAGKDKTYLHVNYGVKLGPSLVLGTDLSKNCYFYFSKINDSIFAFNTSKNQWKKITGQQNVKKQIVDDLVSKPNSLTQNSLDLLENIQLLWNKISFPLQKTAFNKNKEYFSLKAQKKVEDKLNKIKNKLYELDDQYSKFIGDCYNFRWATKQNRIAFRKQVSEAKQMKEVVSSFGHFFHKTKHTIQKKLNTFDIYDYSLSSDDQPETEFKNMFLRMNYLYVKDVFAENGSSKYSMNLYSHIKSFLENSQSFQPYLYEYLTTFLQDMLGIIRQMYPGAIQRRVKILQRLKKQKKERQEQQKQQEIQGKMTRNRLKRNGQAPSQVQSSEQQQEEQQSSTTADKIQSNLLNGRRLRNKVRVDYKAVQSKSKSKSKPIAKPKQKISKPKLRNQPKRGQKGKKSKMMLDSDSDSNQDEVNISLSQSDTEKQDKGLSLDKYKYVEQEDTQKFRRTLRSSNRRS